MEQYAINISNTWSIENLKNVDKDIKLDKVDIELPFGQSEFHEGKINWLLDPLPLLVEDIKSCQEVEAFNLEAHFEVRLLEKSEWKKIDEFEGTIIDALIYIQREFSNG